MELRQLEYFVAVVEEANFTKAAARVHVAQPGVSSQIRRLERELGQELLDRSGRRVRLTAAGAVALPYARAALAAVAGARMAVDELAGLLRGHVTIGTVGSISSVEVDLPGLLACFHRKYPAVEVILSVANSDELVDGLRAGRIDLAFIGTGATAPADIHTHTLTDEHLVAVTSPTHTLAAKAAITLHDLADHALISLPRGTGLRSSLDDACVAGGLHPSIAFEAGDPRVLADLAAHGLGVAVVPRSLATRRQDLHALDITDPALHGRIALAWRSGGPIAPAARVLINHARSEQEDRPG